MMFMFIFSFYFRGASYRPYNMHEDQPSIMEEISNSFSSHMFRNRSRNYAAPPPSRAVPRISTLDSEDEGPSPVRRNSLVSETASVDSKVSGSSKKNRLYKSDLLKQKAMSTIHPEAPKIGPSELSAHLEEHFELQVPNITNGLEEGLN